MANLTSVHEPTDEVEIKVLVGDEQVSINISRLSTIQALKERVAQLTLVQEKWPANCKEDDAPLTSKFVLIDEKHTKAPSQDKVSKITPAKHYSTRVYYLPKGNYRR
jgi:hypothetical protein